MEMCMKEIGLKEQSKDKENLYLVMDLCMKENFLKEDRMEMDLCNFKMDQGM